MADGMFEEMYAAAEDALREVAQTTGGLDMGPSPGSEPVPWKDQVVQFIDDVPDLLRKGPRYQVIDQTYGAGAADEYLATMMKDIWRPRQRRRPQ